MGPLSWRSVRWPAARIAAPDRRATTRLLIFAAVELLLAMAIPFMLIRGYHTLLSSNTGTFVASPTAGEPGWSALVSATPLTAVIEVVDGEVTGATLLVPSGEVIADDESAAPSSTRAEPVGGTVVLVPGDLSIPPDLMAQPGLEATTPTRLSAIAPATAGDVLGALLTIELASIHVMDETGWTGVLAGTTYDLDNPDPVPAAGPTKESAGATDGESPDELAFAVGPVDVGERDIAVFLGRPVDGGSLTSVLPRRQRLWAAMLADPPASVHPLASALRSVGTAGRVVELPTVATPEGTVVDETAAEDLLRDIVAFPSGARLELRVVDRSGAADLRAIAAQLAGRGIEVVEIANAVQFDDGSTELIRPSDLADGVEQFDELVADLGVQPIVDPEQEHDTVTLLVGGDFRLSG